MKKLVAASDPSRSLRRQLAGRLAELTGATVTDSQITRMAWQGCVYVDKVRFHDADAQPPAGTLEVFFPELPVEECVLDPRRVVYEDDHLLAVDKPAGVNTSPSPFSDRDCLTWGVERYLDSGFAVHAVHRLDRDTNGLVLFAKNKEAERGLHALFRRRRILKVYRALSPPMNNADQPAARFHRFRDELDWRGKVQQAVTTVVWEGRQGDNWSWLALPHTGRPHQIRKHFARYLVPLVGDAVYFEGASRPPSSVPLGLSCVLLRFRHPVTNVRLEVRL